MVLGCKLVIFLGFRAKNIVFENFAPFWGNDFSRPQNPFIYENLSKISKTAGNGFLHIPIF